MGRTYVSSAGCRGGDVKVWRMQGCGGVEVQGL